MQLYLRTRLYAFDRPAARGNRSKELDAINAAPHNIEGDAQGRRKEVIQYKDQDSIHLLGNAFRRFASGCNPTQAWWVGLRYGERGEASHR